MAKVPSSAATRRCMPSRTSPLRALGYAAASGITSGAASALTQTVIHTWHTLSWRTVVLGMLTVVLAVVGLLLSQSAYTGGLGAPLAVLTLANPLASAAIGLTLLGERIHGGLTGSAVVAVGATVASSCSPAPPPSRQQAAITSARLQR